MKATIGVKKKLRIINDKKSIIISALSSTFFLLEIYIDNNLKWHSHIDFVCKQLNSKISLLKKIMFYLTDEMKRMFYNAYILPILDYCCHIWGKDNKGYIIPHLGNLERNFSEASP